MERGDMLEYVFVPSTLDALAETVPEKADTAFEELALKVLKAESADELTCESREKFVALADGVIGLFNDRKAYGKIGELMRRVEKSPAAKRRRRLI